MIGNIEMFEKDNNKIILGDAIEEDVGELSPLEKSMLSLKEGDIDTWLNQLKTNGLPPYEWIVHGVLPAGVGLLQAATSVGKTFIALSLAVQAAIGIDYTGKPTHPLNTLMIISEDNEQDLAYRLTAITETLPPPQKFDGKLDFIVMPRCKLLEPNNRGWKSTSSASELINIVKKCKIEFVVIDNLFALSGADPNDATAMSQLFDFLFLLDETLSEVNQHNRVGVLLVHHFKKGQTSKFAEKGIDQGSGSGTIHGRSRFVFNLDRVGTKVQCEELGITDSDDYVALKLVKSNRHKTGTTHVFKGAYVQQYDAFCYVWKKTVHGKKESGKEELTEEILIEKLSELSINKPNTVSTLARKLNAAKVGTQSEITDLLKQMLEKGILIQNTEGQILPLSHKKPK